MNETVINSSIGQLIEPEPIGYSFNTPGWYLVLGVLLLVTLVIALVQYRKYLKNAYRREALARVEELVQSDQDSMAYEINKLLKIVAIRVFGRERVAAMFGIQWFNFLNSASNSQLNVDFEEFDKAIYNTGYSLGEKEKTKLVELATTWIKKHDVKNV